MKKGSRWHSLDRDFSWMVRSLANWTCAACRQKFPVGSTDLHCSHFHTRSIKSTRFDLENCTALCQRCHHYLDNHPEAHRDWKREKLGREKYEALQHKANTVQKVDPEAIRAFIRAKIAQIAKQPSQYTRSSASAA